MHQGIQFPLFSDIVLYFIKIRKCYLQAGMNQTSAKPAAVQFIHPKTLTLRPNHTLPHSQKPCRLLVKHIPGPHGACALLQLSHPRQHSSGKTVLGLCAQAPNHAGVFIPCLLAEIPLQHNSSLLHGHGACHAQLQPLAWRRSVLIPLAQQQ